MTDYVAALRQLLANESAWLDSTAAGKRLDPMAHDSKAVATQARREQRIFAAWDGQCFHYPAFQFEPLGGPRPKTVELIKVLPREADGSLGLDAVFWVFQLDNAFDGKSPAEMFSLEPDRVIELTRSRFDDGRD